MIDANHELVTRAYVDTNSSISEYVATLTLSDITNGYIDVGTAITNLLDFKIRGAGEQFESLDYQIGVPDTRVSWSGLVLDGQLRSGHNISVLYK